MPFHV